MKASTLLGPVSPGADRMGEGGGQAALPQPKSSGGDMNVLESTPPSSVNQEESKRGADRWALLKSFLARNPFYPASALALLYGIGTVSADAALADQEARQLYFNFGSLLIYEMLLMGAAWYLARRRIMYDVNLLVVLENLLVFVPFLLVSQATLLDAGMATILCISGSLLALGRFAIQRWALSGLELPSRLFCFGVLFLLIHLFFPLYFRKVADWDNEAWDRCSPWFWMLLLPALQALMLRLPWGPSQKEGEAREAWMGPLILTFWTAATAVHIASMDYVGDVPFYRWQLGPVLWAVAWTWALRMPRILNLSDTWQRALYVLPVLAPIVSVSHEGWWFGLNMANLAGLTGFAVWKRRHPWVWGLAGFAAILTIGSIPMEWVQTGFGMEKASRMQWMVVSAGLMGTGLIFLARDPKAGLLGAFLTMGWMAAISWPVDLFPLGTLLTAVTIFLLHSLRWREEEYRDAKKLRGILVVIWVGLGLALSYWEPGVANWLTPAASGFVLVLMASRALSGLANPRLLWAAAPLVLMSRPIVLCSLFLKQLPAGYLIVGMSFLLFVIGTILAATKPRWNQ